jgi:hypothetical protein
MASASPKSLASILQQRSDHLSLLLSQVRLLRRITSVIRNALPESLSPHCHAANIDGDVIVIGCDSAAWAAKLRYQLPHVLSRLRDHSDLAVFRQLRVRVQPAVKAKPRTPSRPLFLAEDTAALIASVARNTADPELKAALLRLSRHAKSVKNR